MCVYVCVYMCVCVCVCVRERERERERGWGLKATAVPRLPCRARSAALINYVSLKPYVSHIYFTVVNKTKIVFCSKLCFY